MQNSTPKTLHLVSLGCTKNLIDSEVMLGKLSHYTLVDDPSQADVILLNSCGFIEAAKAESINKALELANEKKEGALLVMTGCLSGRYKEELVDALDEVDLFAGVGEYDQIDAIINERTHRFSDHVYLYDNETPRVITGSNYHAYIKISEGCNQQCSFCAIPSFKGRLQSRSISSIVGEITELISQGYHSFSLISQDSSSFGRDNDQSLIELIKAVDAIPGLVSAKILYLYPSTTSTELIDTIVNAKRFENYFDMPIQHISDTMLKSMRRGFGKEKTLLLLNAMRKAPHSFVRTSFIIGHPGEDEQAFEELREHIEHFQYDRVNLFAYSNEEGTKAYSLEQIDPEVTAQRLSQLETLTTTQLHKRLDELIGKLVTVVIEGESKEHHFLTSARLELWAPEIDGEVLINDPGEFTPAHGMRFKATITERVGNQLLATLSSALDAK